MVVLDSNIISELMKATPEIRVQTWLDRQPAQSVWTTSICVAEIRIGLAMLPAGKRRQELQSAFDQILENGLRGRVLDFDSRSATASAEIFEICRSTGNPIDFPDLLIAGIVSSRQATLATRNVKDFHPTGIPLIDPWNS